MSKDLNDDQEEPLTPVVANPPEGGQAATKVGSKKKKIIAVVSIIALIAIGAGVFLFFKVIKNPKKL